MKPILAVYVALVIMVMAVGAASASKPPRIDPPVCDPVVAAPRHGQDAIDELGDKIANVAAKNRRDEARLRRQLEEDLSLWVDPCGQLFFAETDELPVDPPQAAATLVFPREQTFTLHSRPGASRVIYIDFNGELISGTAWNTYYNGGQDLVAPAFDIDGAPSTYSDNELAIVQNVWLRVAEDFAPFDVDITTTDPGLAAIDRATSTDSAFGTRVLVTNDSVIYNQCYCAGIAYVGAFDMPGSHQYYQPAFAFQRGTGANAKVIGEVIAHEAGHTLGLSHDGTSTVAYYAGQGSWAPIMGTSYNRPISHWSKGEYTNANSTEDDLAVMQARGATLRADDVPSTRNSALAIQSGVPFRGFIGTAADADWFSASGTGQIDIVANVGAISPNLDLRVEVYNDDGGLVAAADPAASTITGDSAAGLSVSLSANLPESGTYYVKLDGVGYGDPASTGYSDYASVGAYTLTVTVLDPGSAPQITTTSLPTASSFSSYSVQLVATSGQPAYSWGLAADSAPLPDALSLAANTGVLSGTPTAAAGTYPLNFKVVDANGNASTKALSLTIADAPLTITSAIPLAPASLTLPYAQQLVAAGGRGSYTWSLASGALPLGLTMSPTGLISGTPTKTGNYSFTARVTSGTATVSKSLSISVTAPVVISSASTLADATVGKSYSVSLAASGGTRSYVWQLESGSLPPGLSLLGNKISGYPTARGAYPFVVRVTDTAGRTTTKTLAINVYELSMTTTALPDATMGAYYSFQLIAEGGKTPYKWARSSGRFPSGVTISSAGLVYGTPSVTGTFTVILKVTDAGGRYVTRTFTLVVSP